VWFLDGVTAFNEIEAGDAYHIAGYALWRLGAEDPSVWSVMGQPYGAPPPEGLRVIGTSQDIDFEGEGEILHVAEQPAEGARTFEVDSKSGEIVDETYKAVPTPFVIERRGDTQGKLAVTFDDGPDPDWTPKILDILKAKGVRASFFIIGESAISCSVYSPRGMTSETTPSPIPISASCRALLSRSRSMQRSGCSRR